VLKAAMKRAEAEGPLSDPSHEMRPRVVVEQTGLAIDERPDALVHVPAVTAAAGGL